jgi:hypothetical protein
MLLLSRPSRSPAPAPQATDEAERSHTLMPLVDAMPAEWASHARRCRRRIPEPRRWALPVLDPDHPRALECTHTQARELLLWLHHLPSDAHAIVGCQRRRAA